MLLYLKNVTKGYGRIKVRVKCIAHNMLHYRVDLPLDTTENELQILSNAGYEVNNYELNLSLGTFLDKVERIERLA